MAAGPGLAPQAGSSTAGSFAVVVCWCLKGSVVVRGVVPYPLSVALDTLGVSM